MSFSPLPGRTNHKPRKARLSVACDTDGRNAPQEMLTISKNGLNLIKKKFYKAYIFDRIENAIP